MAITATAVQQGNNYRSWTLTCLDADTTTTIAHGLGQAPDFVHIQKLFAYASTAEPYWAVTAVDSTNITIQKSTSTGSGGTTGGTTIVAKVYAMLPHSSIK